MDANQDEYLLSCYRQWARDAGVSELTIWLTEREARNDHQVHPSQPIADMFYGRIRHAVAPDAPWKGNA